jgi:hypothetical protein
VDRRGRQKWYKIAIILHPQVICGQELAQLLRIPVRGHVRRFTHGGQPHDAISPLTQFPRHDCRYGPTETVSGQFHRGADVVRRSQQWHQIRHDAIGLIPKSAMDTTLQFFVVHGPGLQAR